MDGYEATRRIKADHAAYIPIIAVTSYALSGDDAQAFAAGCDSMWRSPSVRAHSWPRSVSICPHRATTSQGGEPANTAAILVRPTAMPEHNLILGDIRVLDLSEDIAGPFCTKLLAGLGAEVIKVEPPGTGDVTRTTGPFVHETPHAEQSAAFLYLNTGKKSITLDIQSQTGVVYCSAWPRSATSWSRAFLLDI